MKKIIPFICFQTQAQAAMNFYKEIFPDCKILNLEFYPDRPNLVLKGHLRIMDQDFYFLDMGPENAAPIDWGISFLMEMSSEKEFYTIFERLKEKGKIIMGPEAVPGFDLVTWITDKYGVTWQLVLSSE